jgi:hypothetical protein
MGMKEGNYLEKLFSFLDQKDNGTSSSAKEYYR